MTWIWNETSMQLLSSLTQSFHLCLALLLPILLTLLTVCTEFSLLSRPWNGQRGWASSLCPLQVQQDAPMIIFRGRTEWRTNCIGGCGKQEMTRSPWHFPWNHETPARWGYLYVVVLGTCMTYRSLGNSIFIFINFNYRHAIKFSQSVWREKCRS